MRTLGESIGNAFAWMVKGWCFGLGFAMALIYVFEWVVA